MAFTRKVIQVSFQLQTGTFQGTSANVVTLNGLRVTASINQNAGPGMSQSNIAVYGMTLPQMNQLSTLGLPPNETSINTLTIRAGDDTAPLAAIFTGIIQAADVDFDGAPDVCLRAHSFIGPDAAAKVVEPTSYGGYVDAVTVMQRLARQAGRVLENNGVSVMLSNPYFHGSIRDQMLACVKSGGFDWYDDSVTISIWPKNGSRGGSIITISPQTGMIGYPRFSAGGIRFSTAFNPRLIMGQKIRMQSSLQAACGLWTVYSVETFIESETPQGKWEQTVYAYPPNLVDPSP